MIKLTTREEQIILDPFMGSGTTALASKRLNRRYIGFEINEEYYKAALNRIEQNNSSFYFDRLEKEHSLF